MRIVCPACASEYEIPAERVGASGRQVRCAACRETWFIAPEDVAASANLPATIDAAPSRMESDDPSSSGLPTEQGGGPVIDQATQYPRQRALAGPARSRSAKTAKKKPRIAALKPAAAVIAVGLALFVVGPLCLLGRSSVVSAMPQTAALYARIGLPVNLRGIDIRDVVAFQNPAVGDKPAELVVEGDLVGVGRDPIDVPDIAVEVRDEHDQTLYRWTVPAPRPTLEAKDVARFHASLSAPPAAGRGIVLRFVTTARTEALPPAHEAAPSAAH